MTDVCGTQPEGTWFHWDGGSFRPYASRVLVRLDPKIAKVGMIHIPEAYQRAPWFGEVVAIGPGEWRDGRRDWMDVSHGDRVFFGAYNGIRVDQQLGIRDGHQYWLMNQRKAGDMAVMPDVYAKEEG